MELWSFNCVPKNGWCKIELLEMELFDQLTVRNNKMPLQITYVTDM